MDNAAVSGDGWHSKPDYSAEEVARQIRHLFHDNGWDESVKVEHGETVPKETR